MSLPACWANGTLLCFLFFSLFFFFSFFPLFLFSFFYLASPSPILFVYEAMYAIYLFFVYLTNSVYYSVLLSFLCFIPVAVHHAVSPVFPPPLPLFFSSPPAGAALLLSNLFLFFSLLFLFLSVFSSSFFLIPSYFRFNSFFSFSFRNSSSITFTRLVHMELARPRTHTQPHARWPLSYEAAAVPVPEP